MKAIWLAFALVAGCAAAPHDGESVQYARDDARIRAVERFEALEERCRASGGTVYMDRSYARFPPTVSDLRSATCGARPAPRHR
ncbi:MAG TPA: hypothetical protein VE175_11980 [Woeseiaceae bacterium]|nr:hypothetical protein [Woeseiaceae bacterium]